MEHIRKTYNKAKLVHIESALQQLALSLDKHQKSFGARGISKELRHCRNEINSLLSLLKLGETVNPNLKTLDTLVEKYLIHKKRPITDEDYLEHLELQAQDLSVNNLIPTIKKYGHLYSKVPILPILSKPFSHGRLRERNVKFSVFGSYIVLTDQQAIAYTKGKREQALQVLPSLSNVQVVTTKPYSSEGISWLWLSPNLDDLVYASYTFDLQSWSPFLRT